MYTILLIVIYIAFISLGLPDSILGSAWPSMFESLNVPVNYAGYITMTIALGTIVSSLASGFLKHKLGTGKLMVISVGITALALLGFSFSNKFWQLILLAIPYGLGAGSVDAALNNFVAINYKARHMSFLHCFWGIGTMLGPIVMSNFISRGGIWTQGYRVISIFQVFLTLILALSLPLWKKIENKTDKNLNETMSTPECDDSPKNKNDDSRISSDSRVTVFEALKIPGVAASILTFFATAHLNKHLCFGQAHIWFLRAELI